MGTDTVWILNLDAELELAARDAYHAKARTLGLIRARRGPLEAVLPAGHRVVEADAVAGSELGHRGRAYCPTPTALAALRRLGAVPDPAPPIEVLRAVNDRAFAHALGATLDSERFVDAEAQLVAHLREAPDMGQGFLIKRRLSMAGRGRRRVGRVLEGAELAFVRACFRDDGGLLVEPFVTVEAEMSLHGELSLDGALRLGTPVVQCVDRFGSFTSARRAEAGELSDAEGRALEAAADVAARALHRAGYHGLFGLDAFRYRDASGAERFRPMVELNARMTMALPIGLPLEVP